MRSYWTNFFTLIFIGLLLLGCGSGGSSQSSPAPNPPPPSSDATPPQLVTRSPAPAEKGVSPNAPVRIAFDEPINSSNLADHVRLTFSEDSAVSIDVHCDTPCREITLTPQSPLLFNTPYMVTIDQVADLAGNALPTPISWTFTTTSAPPPVGDTTPPTLKSVLPANNAAGVNQDALITLTFDEGINSDSLSDQILLTLDGDSTPVAGTITCDSSCMIVTFSPNVQLRLNSLYHLRVTDEITDLAKNRLTQAYSGQFVTRATPLPASSPWIKEMGNRFNQNLFGADAVSNHAWAVGEHGLIVTTSDAGSNWALQESGTSQSLYGIAFVDAQTGFAVGGEPSGTNTFANVIIKTVDGGKSWGGTTLSTLPGVLKAIHFLDVSKGWAVGGGGAILTTDDGGKTWKPQQSGVASELTTVDFVDTQHGWATGPGKVLLKTDTGGDPWTPIFTFSSPIRQIDFFDRNRGWAVGDAGALLETNDGGAHWATISVTTVNLTALRITADLKGWAVGEKGTLLRFDGANWTAAASGTALSLRAVAASEGSGAWSVGDYGIITFTSSDGKAVVQNQTTTSELYGPFFINSKTGWTVGSNGRIFRTDTGGTTWTQQVKDWKKDIHWTHLSNPARLCNKNPDGTWAEDPATAHCIRTSIINLYALFFLTPLKGWAIGQPSLILHTEDGGATWTEQTVDAYAEDCYECPKAGIYLRGIQFIDDKNGWAVGRFRTVYKTKDGGNTWQLLQFKDNWKFTTKDGTCTTPSGTVLTTMGGHLFGLSVNPSDSNDVFVAGGCCEPCNPEAIIAHTTDDGLTWDIRTSIVHDSRVENRITDPAKLLPDTGRFHTFQMIGNSGWAAGRGGGLMRTENHGVTWTKATTGTSLTLTNLFFIDPLKGWLVGFTGTLFKTTDGGKSWQRLPSGTRNDLFGVYFVDDQQGWIAGSGDLILTTNGGS
ncbi:MAG: Ig-like domain-containing protein [Nitrospirae bacterium]|nr:Ig-like domain-containing protein [Candidatus Manganitrophaceae bacterium]